ncbi:hypothetical protein [Streptococcus saliviloxodontae]|uniref:Tetratricopeptide (TPR) repeat protein n=1 Tax=Streptococcus saliviloxodontae TaxID=1349416 RepID=A0ABS2PJG0_9STRE|nr:hypothetical protein [Streptococcus saliviloxodontae]MBM7635572.1 tetratricopeptide (TPR) repeat protein [Streptococcus saliviloxodontae]
MTDEKKVIDFNRYREEKLFLDDDFLDSLAELSDDELDDFYDELAFGDMEDPQLTSAEIDELYPFYRALTSGDQEDIKAFKYWDRKSQKTYFGSKFSLGLLCKQNGLYEKALVHFEELYQLDEQDSLGARYEIMACLVLLRRYKDAQSFYDAIGGQGDEQLLVSLFVASLLHDDIDSCRLYVSQLLEVNPHFITFLEEVAFPLPEIMSSVNWERVQSGTLDSLYFSFSRVLPILLTAYGFVHSYLINHFEEIAMEEEVLLEELDFMTDKMREEFSFWGIHRLQDFAKWTEKEVLAFPGIGKVKVQKLKEAGAIFKEE